MIENLDVVYFISTLVVIFFAIGLHEYAHCKVADMAGDPTPRAMGRVTLNLFKHFDLMGTIMIIVTTLSGFGIGWGKPAPMNSFKMRNPRWDLFAAVIAGPLSNVGQAAIYAILFRILMMTGEVSEPITNFFILGVMINLGLFAFNLIPIAPLDGHWLVGLLLPQDLGQKWFKFMQTIGFMPLMIIILLPMLTGGAIRPLSIIYEPVIRLALFFLGIK